MLLLPYLFDIYDHFNQANLQLQGSEITSIDCKQAATADDAVHISNAAEEE